MSGKMTAKDRLKLINEERIRKYNDVVKQVPKDDYEEEADSDDEFAVICDRKNSISMLERGYREARYHHKHPEIKAAKKAAEEADIIANPYLLKNMEIVYNRSRSVFENIIEKSEKFVRGDTSEEFPVFTRVWLADFFEKGQILVEADVNAIVILEDFYVVYSYICHGGHVNRGLSREIFRAVYVSGEKEYLEVVPYKTTVNYQGQGPQDKFSITSVRAREAIKNIRSNYSEEQHLRGMLKIGFYAVAKTYKKGPSKPTKAVSDY